jgi:hypothetical protein
LSSVAVIAALIAVKLLCRAPIVQIVHLNYYEVVNSRRFPLFLPFLGSSRFSPWFPTRDVPSGDQLACLWLPFPGPSTSQTITSWSDPVAFSSPAMLQFSETFAAESVRTMIEWLPAPGPLLVASSEFQITNWFGSMRPSQKPVLLLLARRGFHSSLRAFMSPATMSLSVATMAPKSALCAGRESPCLRS